MSLAWKRAVIDRDAGCVAHHHCEGELQAHHVVTQQHLRKRHLSEHAWDRRIGVTVCERAHRRHHSARERIPFDSLPNEVASFVAELVGPDYLVRYYPGAPVPEPELLEDLSPGRARLRGFERKGGYVR